MMGVPPGTHFLAWFLENAAVVAVSSAVLAVVRKTSGIFAYSDALVVFLFLLDFGVSVIMLSYLLSALFRRASTAALCSGLLYVTSFLPYIVLLVLRSRLGAAAQTCLVGGPLGCQRPPLSAPSSPWMWCRLHRPPATCRSEPGRGSSGNRQQFCRRGRAAQGMGVARVTGLSGVGSQGSCWHRPGSLGFQSLLHAWKERDFHSDCRSTK